jgi:two-component system LytT family sensor kinase
MTPRRAGWLVAAAFWTVFGLVTGLQVWISMILHGHSVPRLVGFYVLVWEVWLGFTAVIVWLTRRFPVIPLSGRNVLIHFLAAVALAVVHMSYWMMLTLAMRPYDRMTPTWAQLPVKEILFFRLPLEVIFYIVVAGIAHAIEYYSRASRLEISLMNARLHALELQIQPHFLFNSLNAISTLVRAEQNSEAVAMIAGLSDLLRYMLEHAGQQLVSIDEESEMVRRYLEIQRMRFPDRLTFAIDIESDVQGACVPTFILQPLAENAIRHGIARSSAAGVVNVRAFRENGCVRIEVFNSGRLSEASADGIGLRNTRERLQQLFGDGQRFQVGNAGGGVLASMTIPFRETACER